MTTTTEAPATGNGPTGQLTDALHNHFIRPEDQLSLAGAGAVFLTEVTAPGSSRRADAVHIGLWQSRGAGRIDVCEVKTSRSDFLRELADPAKAEAWWPYSTAFWLVVPHISIAGPGDLPDGWGLLTPGGRGRRFKIIVKAAEREPRLTTALLLTLLKNTETVRTNALQRQRTELVNEASRREQKLRRELVSNSDPETRRRLALLDDLEVRLGMPLGDHVWDDGTLTPESAAASLRDLAAGHAAIERTRKELRRTADSLDMVAAGAAGQAARLRSALGQPTAQEV